MLSGTIVGSEGLPIAWDIHVPKDAGPHPLAVVVHGFKGFKDWGFFPELCDRLAASGIAACRINTSHNGVGLGRQQEEFTRLDVFANNRTSFEVADIGIVVDAVTNGTLSPNMPFSVSDVALIGHSRGGAASLLAAAKNPTIKAVVTWASVATTAFPKEARESFLESGHWQFVNGRTGQDMSLNLSAFQDTNPMPKELDLSMQVQNIEAATLFIHGKEDQSVPLQSVYDLARFSDGAGEIYLVDGADHVMGCRHPFAGPTPQFESAVLRTIAHLHGAFSL